MSERTRFAPAPTGLLHVGGARTALFSWLVARQSGGAFVLRIEDTDVARLRAGAEDAIVEDLRWLGLEWDEGPDVGGPYAPYRQSERTDRYSAAISRLKDAGAVYPCYCTPEELAAARAQDEAAGRPPRYRGTCRRRSAAERAALERAGARPAWRFAVEPGRFVVFDDAVHGTMRFSTDDIGDFVVVRADGTATYDLACVVDDAEMEISVVVRGDDHLANTARQVLLAEALGVSWPRYAHLPLVTGPSGEPLSKSAGGAAIRELRSEGFLPSAVVEYLASLGWGVPQGLDVRSPGDLVPLFAIERVSPSPATHDIARLRAINARHLRRLSADEFAALADCFVPSMPGGLDRGALLEAVREEAQTGADLARLAQRIAQRPEPSTALAGPVLDAVRAALPEQGGRWQPETIAARLKDELAARGVPIRDGMHAVRAALMGAPVGPPISALLAVLGPRETAARISAASLTEPSGSGDSDVSETGESETAGT